MRSGSTYLFNLTLGLLKADAGPEVVAFSRIDNEDEMHDALIKFKNSKNKLFLVLNSTLSPDIVARFDAHIDYYVSVFRDTFDCIGSAKLRWGDVWKDPENDIHEVITNISNTLAGLSVVRIEKSIVFDYIELYFSPDFVYRKSQNFLS